MFARPELPRGRFLGDRLYLPGQKAENLQVPLRKAGYDLIGDYKKNELGLQTELASGAVVVDGQLYCPGNEGASAPGQRHRRLPERPH